MQKLLEPHTVTTTKIQKLMKELSSLMQSAQLRISTQLRPVTRNATRWSSTFAMYLRFLQSFEFIDSGDSDD